MSKFKRQFDSGTLQLHQFDKLSHSDQMAYLNKEIRKKYPSDKTKLIGANTHVSRVRAQICLKQGRT